MFPGYAATSAADFEDDAGERVIREVERVLAVAEVVEKRDGYGNCIGAGIAGLAQGALVLVLAPEYGDVAGAGGQRAHGKQREEDQSLEEPARTPRERHDGGRCVEMDG